jgi:hypothetical protein
MEVNRFKLMGQKKLVNYPHNSLVRPFKPDGSVPPAVHIHGSVIITPGHF